MKRDPLQVLWRLRDAAVTEASRDLANGLQREREGHRRVQEHEQTMLREQSGAGTADAVAFAQWLPRARGDAARLGAALCAEKNRVTLLQQALATRRTEAKAIKATLIQRHNAEALTCRRAEQDIMDEVAGRLRGGLSLTQW